jgi:formyl-CoA transferase
VRQFADFGADVIKIENTVPEDMGGPREGPDFQNLHRNKRSITLDLKSPQGKDIFMKLVKTADIVVENYRPDVKDRLGIDYESLKKVNKRIILASISGFGQDGPYRARPGFDQIAQGLSGIMSVTGKPGEGPMRVGCAVADVGGGLLAALGHHDRAARARAIRRRPVGAVQPAAGGDPAARFPGARYTMSGDVPEQVGNDHPTSMPTSAYRPRRPHERRRHRHQDVAARVRIDRPHGPVRAPGLQDRGSAREEPQDAERAS